MQLVCTAGHFVPVFAFSKVNGVPQADGSVMSLANAAWIWYRCSAIATIAALVRRMISPVHAPQLPTSSLVYNACISGCWLYLCHLRFVYRFFLRVLPCWQKPVPGCNILRLAFFGPFIGAIARSVGGAISDKFSARAGDVDQLYFYGDFQCPAVPPYRAQAPVISSPFTPYLWGCF